MKHLLLALALLLAGCSSPEDASEGEAPATAPPVTPSGSAPTAAPTPTATPPPPTPMTAATPSPSPTPVATPTPSPAQEPGSVRIDIQGFRFVDGTRSVPAGTAVTFANLDAAPHTATADDGAFDTGRLEPGGEATVTLDAAGTYDYRCAIHPSMRATLTVTSA